MNNKVMAHINSLNGEMDEITVLEKVGDNDYIVDYKGVKCHALFNWFVCEFYADDVYRRIEKWVIYSITTMSLERLYLTIMTKKHILPSLISSTR